MEEFCANKGITQQYFALGSPQQIGVDGRKQKL